MTPSQIATLKAVSNLLVAADLTPADLYGYHLTLDWKADTEANPTLASQELDMEDALGYWKGVASHDFIEQALATAQELA